MNTMRLLISIIWLGICLGYAPGAHAATVSFDPQERTVGLDSVFDVGVNIDAAHPINVISIVMTFPDAMVPTDVSDGNSVINYWIEYPHYDPHTHTLAFSGMIPGGFSGAGGRLVTLKLLASKPGRIALKIDTKASTVYLNTPDADEDVVSSVPLTLAVSAHRNNIGNTIPDQGAPEDFMPVIVPHPDASGRWVVAFATQDKGSGMYRYEVSESRFDIPLLQRFLWRTAESPYVLHDQQLRSYVHIRAIDKVGNERIKTILPVHSWYAGLGWWISYISIIMACILGSMWWRRRR